MGWILETGVRARVNTMVGRDVSFAELRSAHDAVIVATGTPEEVAQCERSYTGQYLKRMLS